MRNKRKEEIITTFKEFLGACIKYKKKNIYAVSIS